MMLKRYLDFFTGIIVGATVGAALAGNSTYIKGPTLVESFLSVYLDGADVALTKDSGTNVIATGPGTGDITLPNATLIPEGRRFRIRNESSAEVSLDLYSGVEARAIPSQATVEALLTDGGTSDGTWSIDQALSLYVDAGGVVFGNATSTGIAWDESNLSWDNIAKRLGIGNASPQQPLHVTGTIRNDALAGGGTLIADANGDISAESPLTVENGGTNSTTALNDGRVMVSQGASIVENAALTPGQLLFPASSGLPDGSSSLFWDNSNLHLGLGTSSPNERLDIYGGRAFRYTDNSSTGNIDATSTVNTSAIRFTGVSAVTLRGLANGADGKELTLSNVTGSVLTIANEHATPSAANRIITGTGDNLELADGASVTAKYDSTTSRWRIIGGSGGSAPSAGGGGFHLQWMETDNTPLPVFSAGFLFYGFGADLSQTLQANLFVPSDYTAGNQINLVVYLLDFNGSGTSLIQTTSTLIEAASDLISNTTDQYTSTNSALSNSGLTAGEYRAVTLDLTNASGEINSNPVAPGDMLKVVITRATDTDTGLLYLFATAAEVKLQ